MAENGFVYIGIDETKKYYKIGKTKDVKRRLKEIRHMNPTFKILFTLQPDQVTEAEAERFLHNLYSEKRVIGEWFDLSIDDIVFISQGRCDRERVTQLTGRQL